MSLISYLVLHLFPSCSPFMFYSLPHLFILCFPPPPRFFVFFLCLSHIRFPLVLRFVLRLFSVYSSFVFNLFYVCFLPSLCLFFICRHLFYAHSSFLPHLFSICFFIYSPFIFHLFFISFPFISPFVCHSFMKPNMVRARSRLNTACRMIDFPLEISSKPTNGCQGETQSFPGKTPYVRLGSEIREL